MRIITSLGETSSSAWKILYSACIATFLPATLRFSGINFPTLRRLASLPKDPPMAILLSLRTHSRSISSASFGCSTTRSSSILYLSHYLISYRRLYSIYEGSVEEWSSILKLAHQWEFVEVKVFALRELERHEIPALQKIILYHTHDVNRNLLQAAYVAMTVRDEPISIEEGRILGLETALLFARAREIARAPVFGGKRSGNPRSAINLAGTELDSLVKDLFQLSLPDAPVERPPSPETPTGRGTPTGGRKTPQLGIQTNGAGSPGPNSYRGAANGVNGHAHGAPNGHGRGGRR